MARSRTLAVSILAGTVIACGAANEPRTAPPAPAASGEPAPRDCEPAAPLCFARGVPEDPPVTYDGHGCMVGFRPPGVYEPTCALVKSFLLSGPRVSSEKECCYEICTVPSHRSMACGM